MKIDSMLDNTLEALHHEVQALAQKPTRSFALYRGRRVGEFDGEGVYVFGGPPAPGLDGAGVRLEVGAVDFGGRIDGAHIIGCERGNLVLSSAQSAGFEFERLALMDEPSRPLLDLREQLQTLRNQPGVANPMLLQTLFANPDPGSGTTGIGGGAFEAGNLEAAFCSEVSLIWTPPGTDDEGFIAACVQRHAALRKRVLVLTSWTAKADAITLMLATGAPGSLARLGAPMPEVLPHLRHLAPSSLARRLEPQLFADLDQVTRRIDELWDRWPAIGKPRPETQAALDELEQERKQLEQRRFKVLNLVIERASVVISPLGRAVSHRGIATRPYDVVVVSGAHRASLAHITWAASLAKESFVCAGDFRQTPVNVSSRAASVTRWMKPNIFEANGVVAAVDSGGWDSRLLMLQTQQTLHPQIASTISKVSYRDLLLDAAGVVERTATITAQPPEPGHAVVFYDIGPLLPHVHAAESGGSRSNILSAALTLNLVRMLISRPLPSVLAVTPYGDQWKLIRALIRDADLQDYVTTTTLHHCAHPQHDALILDLVDSAPFSRVGAPLTGGWGSDKMRQLTAALGGARGKIVVLGDWNLLQRSLPEDAVMRRFLDEMMRGGAVSSPFPAHLLDKPRWPKSLAFQLSTAAAWAGIDADIAAASSAVSWNWPFANADEVFAPRNLARMFSPKGKRALALATEHPAYHPLTAQGVSITRSVRGEAAVQIDDDTLWLLGTTGSDGAVRPFIRFHGQHVARQLSGLFGFKRSVFDPRRRP